MRKILLSLTLVLTSGVAMAAGGGATLEAQTNISNVQALQRGAKLYTAYCAGCHSLQYMRYSRLMEDLELTEDQLVENFIFNDAKPGELMTIAMDPIDAERWLGKAPPDLSLVGRSKGSDWVYTFLKGFYLDETRPSGWNNVLFENTSMPNVLWPLQGIQEHAEQGHGDADTEGHDEGHSGLPVKLVSEGQLSEAEFDEVVTDLVTFLEYVGEPAKLKRESMGIWVLLYLSLFTFLAYLLKMEFWRDVH